MKKLAIILGIIMVPILCLAAVVGFVYFSYREIPVTPEDRQMIVGASDIAYLFEGFEPKQEYETMSKIKWLDGSVEVDYEYDSPSDEDPYISVTVSTELTESDASTLFYAQWTANTLVAKALGAQIEDDDSFYSGGEESRFADLKNEFGVVGHIFLAKKGKRLYSYMISGFTITDVEVWHELFDGKLESL